MFAVRGIVFSHEAVRELEAKLTPALAEELRRRRRGQVGRSWYVDETYLKVQGRWCYLYRAIDRNGTLVDVLFSEHRDMAAAQVLFRSAQAVTGITPALRSGVALSLMGGPVPPSTSLPRLPT